PYLAYQSHPYHYLAHLCLPLPPSHSHLLPLHDALPIYEHDDRRRDPGFEEHLRHVLPGQLPVDEDTDDDRVDAGDGSSFGGCEEDRKSTRLNSSHVSISYAVSCLKTKQKSLVRINHNQQ